MDIEICEEPTTSLGDYARVSIAFEVKDMLELAAPESGLGGLVLVERRLAVGYVKDYDAIDGGGPARWAGRFEPSQWGLLAARAAGRRVGGAVVALDSAAIAMSEGRSDLAVLWDIRVSAEARGRGIGSGLFRAAEAWAAARGCQMLKIETQNINVPACRFYARHGCVLGAIHRFAYPALPDEIQLLWYKRLSPA